VLEVRLPFGIERIGCAFDLEVALRADGLPHPDELLTSGRISEPPRFSLARGKVAVGEPASALVRVPALGPAIYPLPDTGVQLGEGLATDDMAMVVRPAPQDGGESLDELLWRGALSLLTEGADLVLEGLEAGRAGGDLEFGWLAVGPRRFAYGLPSAVKTLRDGGDNRLLRRELHAAFS
jgi:hypothetical protein